MPTPDTLTSAEAIDQLRAQHGLTNITPGKLAALSEAGAFPAVSVNRLRHYDRAAFEAFAHSFRYVTPQDWPTGRPLYRVSLIALRPDPVHSLPTVKHPNGKLLRTHSGADYANSAGLTPRMRRRAWTGVWRISDDTIATLLAEGAIVYGTTKGYIHPDYVRIVTGYTRVAHSGRVLLKTSRLPKDIATFVGTGLWMDVKPGRENDWA